MSQVDSIVYKYGKTYFSVQLQMLSTTVGAMGLITPMAQITEGGAISSQDEKG